MPDTTSPQTISSIVAATLEAAILVAEPLPVGEIFPIKVDNVDDISRELSREIDEEAAKQGLRVSYYKRRLCYFSVHRKLP